FKSKRSQERRRCVPMVARGEPSNGDTRALRLIGNSLAKCDIAHRVTSVSARTLPQGAQSQIRPSRLVELKSQPGAQPVAKREENSAKCWSERQDLNLRPPRPDEVRYQIVLRSPHGARRRALDRVREEICNFLDLLTHFRHRKRRNLG